MTRLLPDIKIIIADDHEIVRDGLKFSLGKYPELQIVGEAKNGRELVDLVKAHNPEVILTDIEMPVMNGIEAVKRIKALNEDIGVICLSVHDEEDLIVDMLDIGAKGYLLKNCDKQELIEAITAVYHGNFFYSKSISNKLSAIIAKRRGVKPVFSDKEIEIIKYICGGFTSKEIGDKVNLDVRTIEKHRERIMEKMGVKNTAQLVSYAYENGIIKRK